MPKQETNDLSGVLHQIESGTQAYRAAATELTKRIEKFEEWLGRLPGKVSARVHESEDERGEYYFILGLQRDGKQWKLQHWIEHVSDEIAGGVHDLRDASVETKIRAMRRFPDLLAAIRDAQTHSVERSTKAAAEFDKFAAMIGLDSPSTTRRQNTEGA